ncbi:helix-turn-helix domain-containing protein [Kitasatospora sp. NPDC001309]|uniref:helix-turn-helix domain-containing protein n=1 Tax=Kitasatospora sp. NPDC001309 TaxID=3364013 RepID=UPI00367DDB77
MAKRPPAPQSVYRRQLAPRLKALREAIPGMTLTAVAEAVEITQGSLSRIETGQRGTTPVLVKALLDHYGVTDPEVREDLLDLVRADNAQRNSWWRKYSALMAATQYSGYVALESSATTLHSYEAQLIPGLLQTEDYARAVISSMRVKLDARSIEDLVEVRMRRQDLLTSDEPPKLWAVIDEAALRRLRGTPALLEGQLRHLLEMSLRPNIVVQLLPFGVGLHPASYGSFMRMGFPGPTQPVVWVEGLTKSVCLEAADDVEEYDEAFDHLRARALGPPETRARITEMIKEFRPSDQREA